MQLWVNLHRERKLSAPGYQPITAAEIPTVALPNAGGTVRVIAGEPSDRRGPTVTSITMLDATTRAGRELAIDLPVEHNALAVMTSGPISADGTMGAAGELVLLENDGRSVTLRAEEDAHVVVLAGQPIDEPIVQYGPFVMNTESEIRQAISDFSAGRLGVPRDAQD